MVAIMVEKAQIRLDHLCPYLAQGMLAYQSSVLYNALPAVALNGNASHKYDKSALQMMV